MTIIKDIWKRSEEVSEEAKTRMTHLKLFRKHDPIKKLNKVQKAELQAISSSLIGLLEK